jgi:hypothetical protein
MQLINLATEALSIPPPLPSQPREIQMSLEVMNSHGNERVLETSTFMPSPNTIDPIIATVETCWENTAEVRIWEPYYPNLFH